MHKNLLVNPFMLNIRAPSLDSSSDSQKSWSRTFLKAWCPVLVPHQWSRILSFACSMYSREHSVRSRRTQWSRSHSLSSTGIAYVPIVSLEARPSWSDRARLPIGISSTVFCVLCAHICGFPIHPSDLSLRGILTSYWLVFNIEDQVFTLGEVRYAADDHACSWFAYNPK